MTISPVPLSLDMTVTCASGVIPMSMQPPAVTPVPAMSTDIVRDATSFLRPFFFRLMPKIIRFL